MFSQLSARTIGVWEGIGGRPPSRIANSTVPGSTSWPTPRTDVLGPFVLIPTDCIHGVVVMKIGKEEHNTRVADSKGAGDIRSACGFYVPREVQTTSGVEG